MNLASPSPRFAPGPPASPSRAGARARTSVAAGLLALTPALAATLIAPRAQAGERRVYLPEVRQGEHPVAHELAELERLAAATDERAGGPERLARALDALLARAADPAVRDLLVPVPAESASSEAAPSGTLYHGLQAAVRERAAALAEEASTALRRLQTERAELALASERPPGPEALVARFPWSAPAADAALTLWERACERGDLAASADLERFLRQAHPAVAAGPQATLLRALSRLSAGDLGRARQALRDAGDLDDDARAAVEHAIASAARRSPLQSTSGAGSGAGPAAPAAPAVAPAGGRLQVEAQHLLGAPPSRDPADVVAVLPAWVGGRVVVSNGASLHVFDPSGEPLGRIPADPRASSRPPAATSAFTGHVASWGPVGFAPLVLERWLAPARGTAAERDPAFRGAFYGLVAFDPAQVRVLWWDGDVGPRGSALPPRAPGASRLERAPPGFGDAPPRTRALLSRAHVLACAADAARVYVALTFKGQDPELWVFAYERAPGAQPLVLRPAWAQAVHLLAVERPGERSAQDAPVAPELAAALRADRDGNLLVSTNLGVSAALAASDGQLRWLHQQSPPPQSAARARNLFRPRSRQPAPDGPDRLEPAALLMHPQEGSLTVVLTHDALVALRSADGRQVWSRSRGEGARLHVTRGGLLVAYDRTQLQGITPEGGAAFLPLALPRRCVGRLAEAGRSLLVPVQGTAGFAIERYDLTLARGEAPRAAGIVLELDLPPEPLNLLATPAGVVAASGRRAVFLRWED